MILLAADKRRSVSAGHCNGTSVAGVRGAGARTAGERAAGARAACVSGAGMRTAGASGVGVSIQDGLLPPIDSRDKTAMSSPGVTEVILSKDALAKPVTGGELCHTVN